ncbi:MAG TPA: hypothetical protein VHP33_33370 [Polyangiaceae bacterium]|nr:hypothetical protein [Polyangiaceae bacterium]
MMSASLVGCAFGSRSCSSPPKEVCEARVGQMSNRIAAYRAAPSYVPELHGVQLPTLHGRPRATAPYRVLEITGAGNWMVVRLSDNVSHVAAQLGNWVQRETDAPSSPPDGIPFYLGADVRTPMSQVAALFSRLGDARVRVYLLGKLDTGPLGAPPPSAKAVADELDRAPTLGDAARIAARDLSVRAASCRPLAKRLVLLKDVAEADQEAALVKALPEGLRDCQCGSVDLDGLEFLTLRLLGAPTRDYGIIALPSDEKGHPVVPDDSTLSVEQWVQGL